MDIYDPCICCSNGTIEGADGCEKCILHTLRERNKILETGKEQLQASVDTLEKGLMIESAAHNKTKTALKAICELQKDLLIEIEELKEKLNE